MLAVTVTAPSGKLSNALLHIVQGLEQLGIDVFTDVDFQPGRADGISNDGGLNILPPYSIVQPTRFKKANDLSQGMLFVDLTFGMPDNWGMITDALKIRPTIFFNMNDSCTLMDYPPQWIVFSANHSTHVQKGGRQFPFSLGVSADLLTLIEQQQLDQCPRNGKILRNFRPSFNQNVRDFLDLSLVPGLKRFFCVDHRFGTDMDTYLQNMSTASGVLAYGGQLVFDYFENTHPLAERQTSKQYGFDKFIGPVEVLRWDGWRFYEACAFGCAPFQLDFGKYGFSLPNPPEAWKEYIPIDLETVNLLPVTLTNRISAQPDLLQTIGSAARQWLLANASPRALAEFTLKTIIEIADQVAIEAKTTN